MFILRLFAFFFLYGFLGWCVEVSYQAARGKGFVNRGFLNGPICPIYGVGVTLVVSILYHFKHEVILLYFLSVFLVTFLEGITGFLMEVIFHHKWWDYSNKPLNIHGYVCLPFSCVWGICCVLIVELIHPPLAWMVSKIPGYILLPIICVLGIATLADLIVTVIGVHKLNHNLAALRNVATELHKVSDSIGESIFEKVMDILSQNKDSIEKIEEAKTMLLTKLKSPEENENQLEKKKQITSIAEKWNTVFSERHRTSERLLKAFPKMDEKKTGQSVKFLRLHVENKRKKKKEK